MKKLYSFLLLSLILLSVSHGFSQLSVSIGTTPAATAGTVTICEQGSIVFSSTSQNVPVGASVSWSFPGGAPASANTIGPHAVNYNSPGTYTATLTINGQSSQVSVVVSPDNTTPSLQIVPFLTNFGYNQDTINNNITIYYCGNQFGIYNGDVQYNMTVGAYPSTHQIIMNWGDGTYNIYAGNVGTVSHIYNFSSNNQFTINMSVVGPNGCVSSGVFQVYSGTAPQISITNNLSTHCIPEPYNFTLNANDIPGTTYEYVFSDNNGAATQITGPFPVNLEYEFAIHSCFQNATITGPGGAPLTYNNAYAASIIATNLCGESFLSIGPIYVSAMPVTDIDMPEFACVGEEVDIINTSLLGMMTGPNGCNPLNKWYWTITPNTGYTVNTGQLGNGANPQWFFWQDGSLELNVTFNDFGTYAVQLIQANACGTDTIIDSICIIAPILADFSTNLISGCSPLQINTSNLPYIPSCIENEGVYNWSVASVGPGACPTEGVLPTYLNGTNETSLDPVFLFNNPGIYEIYLQSTLTNPILGTLCEADYDTVTISVSQGPNIAFQNYAVCEFDDIILLNTVEDCYAQFTDFNWTFDAPPASIGTSTDQVPTLSFNQSGTFPITVLVTNECGSADFNSTIIVYPNSQIILNVPTGACVNNQIQVEATINGAASGGLWTVVPNLGSFSNNTALITNYTPPNNYTGPLQITFTTTNAPPECGQVSASTTIIYELNASANAGSYASICQDGTVNLNGVIGGAASSLTWQANIGGTFSDNTAANSTYTPPAGFTGNIALTLTTDDPIGSCLAATSSTSITVSPPPNITISTNLTLCQGTSIPVSSNPSGTFTGVIWSTTNGTFSTPNQINSNFTPAPNYNGPINITATTTGSNPCPAASGTITITVETAPSIVNTTLVICSGQTINYQPSVNAPNIVPVNTQMTWVVTPNASILGASNQVGLPSPNISQTLVNTSNAPSTMVYTITPIVPSALNCIGTPFTLSVTVLPQPTVNPIALINVCALLPVNVNFTGVATSYSWTNSNTTIGLGSTGTGNISFTAQNPNQNTETSTVQVTPSFTASGLTCIGNPSSFQISSIPSPVVNPVGNQLLCVGALVNPINFSSTPAGSTFAWTNSQPGIGLAANGTGSTTSFNAQNGNNSLLQGSISVIATNSGCFGPALNFTIGVVPVASITNATVQQTLCSGVSSAAVNWSSSVTGFPTTYAWTIQNTGGTISGFTANGTGNLPALNLTNTSNTSGQLIVTVSPTTNNCPGNNFTYTITVHPNPIINPVLPQTICGGQLVNTVIPVSSVVGTAFTWTLQNPGLVPASIAGYLVNGIGNIPGAGVTNSGTQPYILNYVITSVANGCPGNTVNFSLTVNPSPSVQFNLNNQTVCPGGQTQEIIVSSQTPNVTIAWSLAAVPANTTGFNVTTGTTLIPQYTLSQTTNAPITAIFSAQATTTVGNACPGPLNFYEITINPTPTIAPNTSVLLCNGDQSVPVVFTGTGTSYVWQNSDPGIGLAANGLGELASFGAINTSNNPLSALITVTPVFTNNNVSCSGISDIFSILINPSGQINVVNDITSCNGVAVNPILFTTSNNGGTSTYSWTNDNPSIGLGLNQNGVTSINSFVSQNNLTNVNSGIVTVTPTYSNAGLNCAGNPILFNINIIPTPTVNPLIDVVVCHNQQSNQINFSGVSTDFAWTNNETSIGLAGSGTTNIPVFTGVNLGLTPIIADIIVTPTYTLNGVNCAGLPTDLSITVNSLPNVNPVADITICNTGIVPAVLFSGNATSFNWVLSGDNIGSSLNGINTLSTFTATNNTSSILTALATVTPINLLDGYECLGTPISFNIIVNPTPVVVPTLDVTVCHNTLVNQITFTGTGTSYSWNTSNISTGIATSSGLNNILAFTSSNLSPLTNISEVIVSPIFTNNGLSCFGTNDTFNIYVVTVPVVDPIANQEICNGTPTDDVIFSGTGNQYNWTNDNVNIGLGASNTSNILSFIATNPILQSISATITVTPSFTINNVTCIGAISTFNIQVNPTPTINPMIDLVFCNTEITPVVNFTGTATSYSWTNNNTSIGLGTDGTNFIPSFVGSNNGTIANEAVLTIIPLFVGSNDACPGLPYDLSVFINPTPSANAIADQTICISSPSDEVVITGIGTSFEWVNNLVTIGANASGVNIVPVFNGINPTGAPLSGQFTVTPVFTTNNVSCEGLDEIFNITVLPLPIVDPIGDESICNNALFPGIIYSGVFTETQWTNDNISTGLVGSGMGNLPTFSGTNQSNSAPAQAQITIVPEYELNGTTCFGPSTSHNIFILPTTIVNPIVNVEYCNNEATDAVLISSTGTEVSWISSDPSIGINSGNTFAIPSFSAINLGAAEISSLITITPSYTDVLGTVCLGTPNSYEITIHPSPVFTPIADYTICNFATVSQFLTTNVPSNITWSASSNPNVIGASTALQNTPLINNALENISIAPQQITYTANATSIANGCSSLPTDFVVNLMPDVFLVTPNAFEICTGTSVGNVLGANVPVTFQWFGTNNPNVTGVSTSIQTSGAITDTPVNNSTIPQLVIYTVIPTSIDGVCLGETQIISVLITPPPALISNPTASVCSGQAVNYNFVANTSAIFNWYGVNNPNVTGISLAQTQGSVITDVLINNTGLPQNVIYYVTISSAVNDCTSPSIAVVVTINPLPVVDQITQEICSGETVSFNLEASEPSSFQWLGVNNINISGETLTMQNSNLIQNTLTNNTFNIQNVTYNVIPTSLSSGCIGLMQQHIAIVNPLPYLNFSFANLLCSNNEIPIINNSTTPLNVIWDFGNNEQSIEFSPTVYYENAGDYIISFYGINPQTGCENVIFVPVSIGQAPPVDFVTSSTEECLPAFFQFTNTAENLGSILSWDFGDGVISNEQGVTDHFYNTPGCFDVTLTATAPNGCPNSITYEDMVCAYALPIAGFIVNDPIQFGDVNEFIFENLSINAATYFWDLGDGFTTNAVHPGHIYPIERNIYNVMLVATNEAGCSDTTYLSIQVKERLIFYVPNTFTPDGNTRNEEFKPIFTSGYDIYTYELAIFNRWGEVMFESYNDEYGWNGTYGGNVMQDGTYVWRIRFRLLDETETQEYYGHVNLLR